MPLLKQQTPYEKLKIEGTQNWTNISGAHELENCYNTINPSYKLGKEWQENCQRCVPAYEMRRRGIDVTAKPRIFQGKDRVYDNWDKIFKDAQWHITSGSGAHDCERLMKQWGDGARAEIYVSWKNSKSAHVFVAENVKGKVVYLDPQTGKYRNEETFKSAKEGRTRIARIDNLEPSDWIVGCCKAAKEV